MKHLIEADFTRRDLLKAGATLTLAVGAGSLITACAQKAEAAAGPLEAGQEYLIEESKGIVR